MTFHATTACDTTSQFPGCGMITSWKVLCLSNNAILQRQRGDDYLYGFELLSSVQTFVVNLYEISLTELIIQLLRSAMFQT